jgi:hypothetical protein
MKAEYYMSVALQKITESPDVARETVHLRGTSRNARFLSQKDPHSVPQLSATQSNEMPVLLQDRAL